MSKKITTKRIPFTCKAPDAGAVSVAGTFNDWDAATHSLKKGRGGTWKATISVPRGRHEFKFIVDGEWCCDPGCGGEHTCPQCVPNDLGTMNRVIEVE